MNFEKKTFFTMSIVILSDFYPKQYMMGVTSIVNTEDSTLADLLNYLATVIRTVYFLISS